MTHRVGELLLTESSVVVVVSAPHRPEAFDAARFCIDALKQSVPIWKKERWSSGEDWGTNATSLVAPREVVAHDGRSDVATSAHGAKRAGVSRFARPKVLICVPSAITEVERRAVTEATRRAGAADAQLLEQPMAAAIGADLPIEDAVGNMVVDIGGGTTETAVISLGGIVTLRAERVGGFTLDEAIQGWVRKEHGLAIGERTAEEIKMQIGSAMPMTDDRDAEVRGRDLVTGLPKTVVLTAAEIREALDDVVTRMIDSVKECLAITPPELAQDLLTRGIYLVGGGALLRGLPERLQYETKVPVQLSPQPLEAVVLGAGHCIENYQALRGMFMDARR
ncbi:MAG: rod shape-determining protein MreB [Actinobacteria bacterium]|nr:rod shape-determining protein MreB [Actinomycetota bacterium]